VVSFRGEIKLEPHPDWSPLGFDSNFPTSIPDLFIWEFLKETNLSPALL